MKRRKFALDITLLLRLWMVASFSAPVVRLSPSLFQRPRGQPSCLRVLLSQIHMSTQSIERPKVIVIAGPTAVGKSDVAAAICSKLKGMIISADSVQAYRGVQIGANKPSAEEQRENPHILVDVADRTDTYNAASWSRDAILAIEALCGVPTANGRDQDGNDDETRRKYIAEKVSDARSIKGYELEEKITPVVCGGTMMYIQWLVHGRPDAMKPSEEALKEADAIMSKFESIGDYMGAVEFVGSLGKKFADRARSFCDKDFYRLRRTLEVALTVKGQPNEKELIEALYTGKREGDLPGLGYDVRCFFLCPDLRMKHASVVDERCEQMIMKGLLKETTDLTLSNKMPDMVQKAIGYRQAIDYLKDVSLSDSESDRFNQFLNDFSTATRRYAKQQMAWFRRDKSFVFVPVSLEASQGERVQTASDAIQRYCEMSREEYEFELSNTERESAMCKKQNEKQGSKMKFYHFNRCILSDGRPEFESALSQALECRQELQSPKRRRVGQEAAHD